MEILFDGRKRPGVFLPIEENERGTYIFNSKDLCMVEYIPELIEAGIDSFKVEGRMKTALYVATIARTYRKAIDDYFTDPNLYEKNKPLYMEEAAKGVNRQFTTGFFLESPLIRIRFTIGALTKNLILTLGLSGENETACIIWSRKTNFL